MDELASNSILVCIAIVTIERKHKYLTVGGEKEGRCGYDVGAVHEGIPCDGACPPARGAHDGG
jgi:hypothetical protein